MKITLWSQFGIGVIFGATAGNYFGHTTHSQSGTQSARISVEQPVISKQLSSKGFETFLEIPRSELECAAAVDRIDADRVLGTSGEQKRAFWEANANAATVLRYAFRREREGHGFLECVSRATEFVGALGLDPQVQTRLLRSAFAGCMKAPPPTVAEVSLALKRLTWEDERVLLMAYLSTRDDHSPEESLTAMMEALSSAFPNVTDEMRKAAAESVANVWAFRDPSLAVQFIRENKLGGQSNRLTSNVLKLALAYDGEAALALLSKVSQASPEAAASAAIDVRLAPQQLSVILAQLQPKLRDDFLNTYIRTANITDLQALLDIRPLVKAEGAPMEILTEMTGGLCRMNASFADEWLAGIPEQTRGSVIAEQFTEVRSSLSRPHPLAELYLKELGRGYRADSQFELSVSVSILAKDDFESLLKLSGALSGELRDTTTTLAFKERAKLVAATGSTGLDQLMDRAPAELKADVAGAGACGLARVDLDAGLNWARQISDPNLREKTLFGVLANEDSGIPVEKLEASCFQALAEASTPEVATPAFERLVHEYAAWDTSRATGCIDRIPAGPLKDKITLSFAEYWARYDPPAASEWVSNMPAGSVRDRAAATLVAAAKDNPERALECAFAISDPELRFSAAKEVVGAWNTIDPAYAAKLVTTSKLTPSDQHRILETLTSKPSSPSQ